jgi:hypothetical protein
MDGRRLLVGFLALACSIIASGCGPAGLKEGEFTVVRLPAYARTDHEYLEKNMKGATDGLSFLIFVAQRPSLKGRFALQELRDFQVEGKSYRELSTVALGRPIEPMTVIWDIPEFTRRFPDMAEDIPTGYDQPLGLVVTIGGTAIPDDAACEVTIPLWWEKKRETFTFEFRAPRR